MSTTEKIVASGKEYDDNQEVKRLSLRDYIEEKEKSSLQELYEEKEKLEKYTNMMNQVQERLQQLR